MSGHVVKRQDLLSAIAKAGAPSAAEIPTRRVPKRKKELPGDGKTNTIGGESPAKRITRLNVELKDAKNKRGELEARIKILTNQAKSEQVKAERSQRQLGLLEDVIAKVRRALAAGKDAKAEDMPGRITNLSVRATALEAEAYEASVREASLRNQIESLSQELAAKNEEVVQLKRVEEPPITENQKSIQFPDGMHGLLSQAAFSLVDEEGRSEVEEVVPTFFSRVEISDPFEQVKERYAAWILGLKDYSRSRRNRVRDGVGADWDLQDLLGNPSEDLEGSNGTRVTIRTIDGAWFLRFIHRDSRFEGTEWWNLTRLTPDPEGTRVEHAMIRFTGARAQRPDTMAMPRVLKDLLRSTTRQYVWEDFDGEPKEVTEANASLFVEEILMSPNREVPVVVVSRCNKTGAYTVNPHELAKALDGLAVVFAMEAGNNFLLTEALRDAGIDSRLLGCFDGGVRMYMPEFGQNSDPYRHSLWVRTVLEERTPEDRIKLVTRKVAAYAVGLRVPAGFARVIEEYDLKVAAENATRLVKTGPAPEQIQALVAQVKGLQEALERLRSEVIQVQPLRVQLAQVNDRAEYLHGLNQMMEHDLGNIKAEKEDLQRRFHNLKINLDQAEAMNREAQSAKVFLGSGLIDGLLQDSWSPIGAYARLLQARYPDRVVFLPEALASADECTCEMEGKAKQFLLRLVTEYFDILARGHGGDGKAAKLFGKDGFASKESDNLSAEGIKARTREYEGEEILFETHIKITKAFERNTSNWVFRTYFHWDGRRSKLLVGHIGKHLPL